MDLSKLLFGFHGRINRAKYWLAFGINIVVWGIAGAVLYAVGTVPGFILLAVAVVFSLISGIAVGIKRLHDRDKSGWWLLLFYLAPGLLDGLATNLDREGTGLVFSLASLVVSIWGLIELGFLRDTTGPNRYGPDPLQPDIAYAR
jgi:uncharacterized membrane protein YhaH (DUF805 family)